MTQATNSTRNRVHSSSALKSEESLVPDARGGLSPSQMVEDKLVRLLQNSPVLVSHLQDSVKRRPH